MLSKTHSKYIQSLHHKKQRDAHFVFVAEGSKTVAELIAAGNFDCKEMVATANWLQQNSLFLQKHYHGSVTEALPHEMEKISSLATAGEVLAIFAKKEERPFDAKGKITLVLDTIQDPGNLGTIIRIADWFGVKNMVCSNTCADMYNPKTVQSTMGSLGRVNIVYTDILSWLRANEHIKTLAAALDGKPLQQYTSLKEAIIVIGNESKGISPEVMALCKEKITIPKTGEAESLNAAVATGIILSHVA